MSPAEARRITSLGDSLIDFLPLEEDGQTAGFRMAPGGAMLNVAVGLARLGAPAAYAGKIADDFFGQRLRAYLKANAVDQRYVTETHGHTTLAFTAIQNGEPVYTFYGDGTADTLLTMDELPEAFFRETVILHAGSTSLLRGTTPAATLAAMERLRGHALVSLDPNMRPSLVNDARAFRDLFDHLVALTDVLKLSTIDLDWLFPGEREERAVERLLARGPELVLVTHGHEGVSATTRAGERLFQPAFRIVLVDTVGAGDAFSAGLLTGLFETGITTRAGLAACGTEQLAALLRWASAVAALNCTRPGANPPYRADVDTFLSQPKH